MGELLLKGQLAVEPAADQRLVALVHSAQSDQPSDRTNEPSPENSPNIPSAVLLKHAKADCQLINIYRTIPFSSRFIDLSSCSSFQPLSHRHLACTLPKWHHPSNLTWILVAFVQPFSTVRFLVNPQMACIQKIHSHTDCNYWTFLHCALFNKFPELARQIACTSNWLLLF